MEVLLYFRSISRLSVHPNLEQLGLVHVARGTALLHVCRTGIQHQRSMKNSILTLRDFFSFTNRHLIYIDCLFPIMRLILGITIKPSH